MREGQGFKGSAVQGFKGSGVQWFSGSMAPGVHGFNGWGGTVIFSMGVWNFFR